MQRIAPLSVAMLLAVVGINAWLVVELAGGPGEAEGTPKPVRPWAPDIPALDASGGRSQPINTYDLILAQPLFSKSRRPYVPPAPAQPVAKAITPMAPPADPGLILGGIMITGEDKAAYVFTRTDAKGTWLREGQSIGGWQVEAIEATGARLQSSGRSLHLQLYPQQ